MINEFAGSVADLENRYRAYSDDEILQLAIDGGLSAEAQMVLQAEMRRRTLDTKDINDLKDWEEQQKPPPPPPKRVFLGYGTSFVGKKFLSDEDERRGVFVATKFVVLRDLPFVPIGSYRVTQRGDEFPQIEDRVSLQWDQVWVGGRPAWLAVLAGLALAALCIYSSERK